MLTCTEKIAKIREPAATLNLDAEALLGRCVDLDPAAYTEVIPVAPDFEP